MSFTFHRLKQIHLTNRTLTSLSYIWLGFEARLLTHSGTDPSRALTLAATLDYHTHTHSGTA